MAVSRAAVVDQNFLRLLDGLHAAPRRDDLDRPVRAGSELSARLALGLFESMVGSRHLDFEARNLKATDQSFYTIGSSGHEGNAVVAAATRPTDMAFLHYRSGGFFAERARQVPGSTPILDVLLGLVASLDEPIAGGRHKVFGSVPLCIPPQTSTIASHLPKAVGAAFTLARRRRLGLRSAIPDDSVIVCTFGDASSNHSTACGAFNSAALADHQRLPCPVLFVCEDNGIGISTRTPEGWVGKRFSSWPGLQYFHGDALDLPDAADAAFAAVRFVRETRRPAFLHLKTVRLLGHAGSDVEQSYRSHEEIEATESADPLLSTARLLVEGGWATPEELRAVYEELRARTAALGREASRRPKLESAAAVIAPLAPWDPARFSEHAATLAPEAGRADFFEGRLPEADRPRHMAVQINRALGDALVRFPDLLLFGEDVARKGGVYNVTTDLERRAGVGRVFNTHLDEQAILGLAIGAAHQGALPVPEIQYLAYLHNAIDQLRGEACSLQFFSDGQYTNGMVVRIAGLAYQKGFGGHFHNDNALASLRDIPGLIVACPSNGEDAVLLLRGCLSMAQALGRVAVFLEPIALYMTKDLHEDKDGRWSFAYPEPGRFAAPGTARTWGDGGDLTLISYANGHWMSLRVAARLEALGVRCRNVDLRWIAPLPEADILREAEATGRVLVVDECRRSGGLAEPILALLAEHLPGVRVARVTSVDTYIPLGAAANLVLVQEPDILAAALRLLGRAPDGAPLPAEPAPGARP